MVTNKRRTNTFKVDKQYFYRSCPVHHCSFKKCPEDLRYQCFNIYWVDDEDGEKARLFEEMQALRKDREGLVELRQKVTELERSLEISESNLKENREFGEQRSHMALALLIDSRAKEQYIDELERSLKWARMENARILEEHQNEYRYG